MKKIAAAFGRMFMLLFSIYLFALWILSGLIHIWTIYISYHSFGTFWGIVTLFFPVVSEIIIGFISYKNYDFESPYIQWLIVLLGMWIIYIVFVTVAGIIGSFFEEKK